MRTLIVEDDFTSRLLLEALLSPYGECHIAMHGKDAVTAVCNAQKTGQSYDLICMDIMMPEMDGQAAATEIRTLEEAAGTLSSNRIKIIMTTALGDVKNVVESYKGLFDATLSKPLDKGILLEHLRNLNLL